MLIWVNLATLRAHYMHRYEHAYIHTYIEQKIGPLIGSFYIPSDRWRGEERRVEEGTHIIHNHRQHRIVWTQHTAYTYILHRYQHNRAICIHIYTPGHKVHEYISQELSILRFRSRRYIPTYIYTYTYIPTRTETHPALTLADIILWLFPEFCCLR